MQTKARSKKHQLRVQSESIIRSSRTKQQSIPARKLLRCIKQPMPFFFAQESNEIRSTWSRWKSLNDIRCSVFVDSTTMHWRICSLPRHSIRPMLISIDTSIVWTQTFNSVTKRFYELNIPNCTWSRSIIETLLDVFFLSHCVCKFHVEQLFSFRDQTNQR